MPFFSSFTGSFSGGRRKPISIGGGGGGGADFSVATNFASALSATPIDATNWPSGVFMSADKSTLVLPDSDDSLSSSNGAIHIYSNDNAGNWDYVETIVPPSQTPGANGGYTQTYFGTGVSLSTDGSKIAVSGYGHGVNGANQNQGGAIWVLEKQGDGKYTELDRIDRPISDDTNLGAYIDISGDGNYIAVAGKDKVSPNHAANTVYKFNSGTGTYEKMSSEVTSSGSNVSVDWNTANSGSNTRFNSAISDDGLYVVIGNPEANNWGNAYGFAGVGFYDGADWGQQQELRPASLNPPFVDDYGVSVDINSDGSVIAVGAYKAYDSTNAISVGAVYIWRRTGSTWTEEAKIYTPDGVARIEPRWFGSTVKLLPDGNTLFANSVYTFSDPSATGKIYVYTHSGGTWSLAETIDTGYTGNYSNSPTNFEVSRDGSLVAIAAYNDPSRLQFFETTGGPYYSVGGGGGSATYSLDGASVSSTFTTSTAPYHFQFNADGTEITGTFGSDLLLTTTLSTPYDPTTGSYSISNPNHRLGIGALGASTIYGFRFNDDGTKAFFTHQTILTPSRGQVTEYSLSTPYDISTLSSTGTTAYDTEGDFAATDLLNINSIAFNADGTKMFLQNSSTISGVGIFEYDLSSAYTLSTASYSQGYLYTSVLPADLLPQNILFNNAGTKLYVTDFRYDSIYEFDLSTGFDLSTISYNNVSLSFAATDTFPYQMMLSQDETQMYIMGKQNNNIYTLDLVQE